MTLKLLPSDSIPQILFPAGTMQKKATCPTELIDGSRILNTVAVSSIIALKPDPLKLMPHKPSTPGLVSHSKTISLGPVVVDVAEILTSLV